MGERDMGFLIPGMASLSIARDAEHWARQADELCVAGSGFQCLNLLPTHWKIKGFRIRFRFVFSLEHCVRILAWLVFGWR